MLRRALISLVLLGALACGRASGEDAPDAERGIAWPAWSKGQRAAYTAFASGNPAKVRALGAGTGEPTLNALLFVTVRVGAAEPATAARLAEAAREVAQGADGRARGPWLGRLVEGWLAADKAAAEARARWLTLHAAVVDAGVKANWPQLLEAATALDPDPATADPWTLDARRMSGYALLRLRRFAEAETRLGAVVARCEDVGLLSMAARAWNDLAETRMGTDDREGELAALDRAFALYDALGDGARRALVRRSRGANHLRAGRLSEAIAETEAAVAESERAGATRDATIARGNLGEMFAKLGRYEAARAAAERARTEFLAQGLKKEAATALSTLGRTVASQGRFAEALDLYGQALAELEGDASRAAHIVTRIASLRLQMGDAAGALEHAQRARAVAEASGDRGAAAQPRTVEGWALRMLGRTEEALAAHREVVATVRALRRTDELPGLLTELAEDLRLLGRHAEARAALMEALEEGEKSDDGSQVARTKDSLGRLLREMGDAEGALKLHREAAATLLELGDRDLAARAVREGAVDLGALERPAEALLEFRRGLDLNRGSLEGVGDGEAGGLLENRAVAVKLALESLRDLAESGGGPGASAREALWLIEDGRARLLSAGLDRRREILAATVPVALLEEEALARARLETARLDGGRGGGRSAVDAAYAAYDEIVRKVVRSSRRAALASPPAPEPDRIVAALGPHDALVLLQAVGPDVCAVVVTPSGPVLRWLKGSKEILGVAGTWFDLAGTPDGPESALATRLYDLLFRPLEPDLAQATRWLVAGGGLLSLLPLGALVRKDGDRTERLVERVEIASVPSGTVLALLREDSAGKPRGRGLVALGDPAGMGAAGLAPLAASAAEVRQIAALHATDARTVLLGADATPERLKAALAGASAPLAAVHLACHGTIDLERPRLTALRLADGRTVGMDELATWRIPADLAVLAACETARGRVVAGEGVLGFPRAFFLAGVPRVVVSPWRVSDETAGPLLQRFHALVAKDGLAPGAALRQAQLERLKAGGPLAHPYHWAGFMLWGLPD